jgi:small GTP-binding protein
VGDPGVGKTAIISSFFASCYYHYLSSHVSKERTRQICVDGMFIKLTSHDTPSTRGANWKMFCVPDACILVYDVTKSESLSNTLKWRRTFLDQTGHSPTDSFPFLVLGNKSDLESARVVTTEAGQEFARTNDNLLFCECSAKSQEGLRDAMNTIVREAIKLFPQWRRPRQGPVPTETQTSPSIRKPSEQTPVPVPVPATESETVPVPQTPEQKPETETKPIESEQLSKPLLPKENLPSETESFIQAKNPEIQQLLMKIAEQDSRISELLSVIEAKDARIAELESGGEKKHNKLSATSECEIISYLTREHGGNVHEKGVVIITSRTICDSYAHPVHVVADLTSNSRFESKSELNQWIIWDFRALRVEPIRYKIRGISLKSWVVEGSMDGVNWMEMGRERDNQDFIQEATVWFPISNPMKCRFIRLTQVGPTHDHKHHLLLSAVDFFGTISQ